jgi:2',3'-cyclic-nucleotide 2'-phosphodiesterase (5'-nucleotidase family)
VPLPTSFGESGSCAGIVELLERERARQPTIWLDSGDLTVGPVPPLLGSRPWADVGDLPIAAAAAGNHEFDDGVPALLEAAQLLPFPLLCGNVDIGLPGTTLIESGAGPIGVIGLTHPQVERFTRAPTVANNWSDQVASSAHELRAQGARWVVSLLHDGVVWWPNANGPNGPIETRFDGLDEVARPWAEHVDLILCAHTHGGWVGELAGTPAGQAYSFASSVLVVDLAEPPTRPVVRGSFRVPPRRPSAANQSTRVMDAAASEVVGRSKHTWITRTGAQHYLPDLVAAAFLNATSADAALIPAGQSSTQAPLDGAVAGLRAGPVTQLDLVRLFSYDDDHLVVVELAADEFRLVVDFYNQLADPHSRESDYSPWNTCRMPPGVSRNVEKPRTVAVMNWVVPRLGHSLHRDLDGGPATVGARDALLQALG